MGMGSMPLEPMPDVAPVETEAKEFRVDEANRLLPEIDAILREMDGTAARLREVADMIQDLEEYWGARVLSPGNVDNPAYADLLAEQQALQTEMNRGMRRIHALGAILKDFHLGLVDFHARVGGDLVFLCWQRGEPSIRFYHSLEGGYAARRPLAPLPQE